MATIKPGDGDARHGTYNGYGNLKCRCEECRTANADWNWMKRRERAARGVPSNIHGKSTTYSNWMCRCDECRGAHNTYYRGLNARRRAKV